MALRSSSASSPWNRVARCSGEPVLNLIINADDLGLHPAVRRAVEEGAARGTITSASVLANGPDVANVRPLARVSLGAHLNVLRGKPLSPPHEVSTLINARGEFLGSWRAFALRLVRGAIDRDEVKLEWGRQVESLRERGLTLSHVDSEKHTHCSPSLFPIACEVAVEHNISFVRTCIDVSSSRAIGIGTLRRLVLRRMMARCSLPSNLRSTTGVWGITHQGAQFTAHAFAESMTQAGLADDITIEIITHPGRTNATDHNIDASFGRMRVEALWEPELRSLLEDAWLTTVQRFSGRLVSFDEL